MTERHQALDALAILGASPHAPADDLAVERAMRVLRKLINDHLPPEESENVDPVGDPAGERWVIEIGSGKEGARVPLGPALGFTSKADAQQWAQHMPSARVRRVDGGGESEE